MKSKHLAELERMISQNKSGKEIESLCRSFISDEVLCDKPEDEKSKAISNLIEQIHIPIIEKKQGATALSHKQEVGPSRYSDVVGTIVCATVYYGLYKLTESHFFGVIGGIIGGVSASKIMKKMDTVKVEQNNNAINRYVYKNITEIESSVDKISQSFNRLLETEISPNSYLMEEKPYISALRWLYDDLRKTKDAADIEDLTFILNRCGYGLVEYSLEYGDMFDKSSANILNTQTTVKALINTNTNDCIIKGKVVFPLEK